MDISKEKSGIFGKIAALRVSTEAYPLPSISNNLPSLTSLQSEAKGTLNDLRSEATSKISSEVTNTLNYLTDLIKSLVGFEALKDTLVDTLSYNLDSIELKIKHAIKLKSLISCSVNPSIPDFFIDDGITIELDKIDFLGMFKIDPISDEGKLLYNDVFNSLNSTDFNTYLHSVIQDNGGTSSWGLQTTNHEILQIKFDEVGSSDIPNNSLNIKPSSYYANNKKLPDLNNDFIDSIKLFNAAKLINSIIEAIFGTITSKVNKDKKLIKQEIRIEDIVNRIINTDCDVVIDNSYYTFTNEELNSIEYRAELKRSGNRIITTCGNAQSSVSFDTITQLNSDLTSLEAQPPTPELTEDISKVIRQGLDDMANDSADNVGNQDKANVKSSFIESMLKQLMSAIVNVIISPKLTIILAMNHTIIYGEPFKNVEDFMKKNEVLLAMVLQTIRDEVTDVLTNLVLKEVKKLVSSHIVKTQIEKIKYKKAQVASLVGVPNDILRKISGIVKK